MKANMTPFLPFLGASMVQYIIPVYQRTYAWDQSDCQILWEDIIRAGRNMKPHFIGSILHVPQEETATITAMKKHLVIDGQQRLTTSFIFLLALKNAALKAREK